MCCSLGSPLKIQPCGYLTKKYTLFLWEKNSHGKILKGEPKEQYLSTVFKSCLNHKILTTKRNQFIELTKDKPIWPYYKNWEIKERTKMKMNRK